MAALGNASKRRTYTESAVVSTVCGHRYVYTLEGAIAKHASQVARYEQQACVICRSFDNGCYPDEATYRRRLEEAGNR